MGQKKKFLSLQRRLFYFLALLSIIVPILVGVLVWYFTSSSCSVDDTSSASVTDSSKGVTTKATHKTTTQSPSSDEPWKNLRLPKSVKPKHYDITLYPNFYGDNGWFFGNETIEIDVMKNTNFILIHINYLNVTKTVLRSNISGQEISIKRPFFYEENQFWVIETLQPLTNGEKVFLDLEFDGSLTRAIVGFYKSKYVNSLTNKTRSLASSKFEPVSARRAFPCFDEPNFKAEYSVHLVHQSGYIALSNMPDTNTSNWSEDSSLQITDFQRSVKMSTYLVCFIVCDFSYLEAKTKYGTRVRTYATPDRVNQTSFALEIAVHTMGLYQDVFNVSYPLPKQDLIGIPDFVSGAMEHWGLITYRETNMLYDPKEASTANQQRVATVVAHEISHQWFGNIVTMDWWDDLWLNEGFASYMEYFGSNSAEPSWDMTQQFVTTEMQPVMVTDSALASHPIIVNVKNPNQINEVFDSISYNKGASVIRMLEDIMGKDDFFKGVGNYLKAFKWGNAKTDDLWEKLDEVNQANFRVKPMMDTWTRQMGFPYINVSFHTTNGQPKVTVNQKRFLADKTTTYDENESDYRYRWYINIAYQTNTGKMGNFWLNKTDETVTVDVPINPVSNAASWIKFNVNQTGYYRVNYPSEMWERFAQSLKMNADVISDVDKAGLIDDAFNLARGGYIDYSNALDLSDFLDKETNYLPWKSIYTSFGYISDMFQTVGTFAAWRKYVLKKSKPILELVGWNDEGSHLDKLLRTKLISLTCGMGDQDCLQNASKIFRNWMDNDESIPPNLRSLVYKFGMQSGGSSDDWDRMWLKYKTETVPQEKIKLLYGLAQTKQLWLLARYLEYARDENMVRSQDFFTVLTYISENPIGKTLVWEWVQANWDYLVDRFTLFSRYFGRLVPNVISDFNSKFHLKQVEDFFAKYPNAGAGARGRKQALESINRNINWMERHENEIRDWLCKHTDGC